MNSFLFNSNYFNSYINSSSNPLTENGYNVLSDNGQIQSPKLNEIRMNLFFITTNQIFPKIINKEKLTEKYILIVPNSGGGNCFYKTISQFFTNKENYHFHYRKLIAELIFSKYKEDNIKYPFIYYNNNSIITYAENFNKLIMTRNYAGQYEIINTCISCKINICIYKNNDISNDKKKYSYSYETFISDQIDYNQYNPFIPTVLIGWINNNHFELLVPTNTDIEMPVEFQMSKNHNSTNNSEISNKIEVECSNRNDNKKK